MSRLEHLNKKISDLNAAEARGWTINCLLEIEHFLDKIILAFFEPKNENIFKDIVLNSSILDMGSKLKILRNIGFDKSLIEKIRRISAIRNGFAHAPILNSSIVTFGENEIKGSRKSSAILVMNSQGEIKGKNAPEYLYEFFELNNEIVEKLKTTIANTI